MKIDIHTHTRKVKSGDALTRNIESSDFGEIVRNTDVKIMAITNHNLFDKSQFEELTKEVNGHCDLWPGVELDVMENGYRAHLIVISNPIQVEEFDLIVKNLSGIENPDKFTITINEIVENFQDLDCIYIAHYNVKRPNLSDEDIELLSTLISNPKRILKEATNSISAGIYISHGHNSIYGSDVQDWNDYLLDSDDLPDLRLPVESFEQFCLLLEKDEATINTILDQKVKESIELVPFSVADKIIIDVYNDINIIFGSKGTGKTEILEALSRYYNSIGHKTEVYKSNDLHLKDAFDLKGNHLEVELSEFDIYDCEDEIEFIKGITEEEVTSISKYRLHFSSQESNKISQELKLKDIGRLDESQSKRNLNEISKILEEFTTFVNYIYDDQTVSKRIDTNLIDELKELLSKILDQLVESTDKEFAENNSIILVNRIVEKFQEEIAKKTGQPQKPLKTGFAEYARNRIKVDLAVRRVIDNTLKAIEPQLEYAGSLGDKGDLYCQTNLKIQDGKIVDSNYSPFKSVKKSPQKEFSKVILSISKHIYSTQLFNKIAELNEIEGIETIESILDLLLFSRHFTLNTLLYKPSNGESSMVLLHQELKKEKEIYLIDEPEKSLGNDYINDVIVPLLKEKASLGLRVIIATHDANIAVRTLPYNSIYRAHDLGLYSTLTGNPFSNKLKCIYGKNTELDWKKISMKTLEGGEEAFGERGKIYGT